MAHVHFFFADFVVVLVVIFRRCHGPRVCVLLLRHSWMCVSVCLRCFDFRPSAHLLVPLVERYFLLFVFVFPCWNFAIFAVYFFFYFDGIPISHWGVSKGAIQQIVNPMARGQTFQKELQIFLFEMVKLIVPIDTKDAQWLITHG